MIHRIASLFVLVGVLGCEGIQDRMMERAAQQAAQDDRVEWLDDGALHVVLCGTGSPIPAEGRASACTAVIAGGHFVLVDVGPGSYNTIGLHRLPRAHIDSVLLTHFHSDHMGDLGEIGMQSWAFGRAAPLRVYGPPGVKRVVSGFTTAYGHDTGYRVEHHGADIMPRAARALEARVIALPKHGESRLVFEADGLAVRAFSVNHKPVTPAYGYRFDYKGRSVVVSGDTAKSANLVRNSQGVDLLVHEALAAHMIEVAQQVAAKAGMKRRAKIMADILDYHTTPVEAAEVASETGASMLVLNHLVPAPPNAIAERLFLRGTADAFAGEIVLGEDGMHFRLPADSDAIHREMLD